MDEYWIGSPRDAAAHNLGQDAAQSFFDSPVEGDTMESFVLGEVTGEIVRLTGTAQKVRQGEIKAWRRRNFAAPIALALLGMVTSVASTPGSTGGGSYIAYVTGFLGLAGGSVWLIANAFRASKKMSQSQEEREAETGRLLTLAREAAAATYLELERGGAGGGAGAGGGKVADVKLDAIAVVEVAETGEPAPPTQGATPVDESPVEPTPQQDVEENYAPVEGTAVEDTEAASEPVPEQRHVPNSPPPPGQPFGVTQEGAAYLVAAWMRHLGDADAGTADYSAGGGYDAASTNCVAKAKNDAECVSTEEIQALVDAAAGRRALFFASGSYSDGAHALAEEAAVALFTYDAVIGTLDGANQLGRTALLEGLR